MVVGSTIRGEGWEGKNGKNLLRWRALHPFPIPVRALDALHLASVSFLREHGKDVTAVFRTTLNVHIHPIDTLGKRDRFGVPPT
jgi:hypothetical protein